VRRRRFQEAAAIVPALMLGLALLAGGCATVPGKTGQEQALTIEELEQRTLADLEKQHPNTRDEIAQCVGYVIMNNKLTKIPVVGVGAGYGVGVNKTTGERTYLRMRRFDIGAGWGARALRPVLIFQDSTKYRDYVNGDFEVRMGAEATAKAGEKGGGGGAGASGGSQGYTSYVITDTGVSATASLAVMRVKKIKLKS
jgi:uncharacterized spore protein YtfJ